MNSSSGQQINKTTEIVNTYNETIWTYLISTRYYIQKTKKYFHFSSSYRKFFWDRPDTRKQKHQQIQGNRSTSSIFSDHYSLKLEINHIE